MIQSLDFARDTKNLIPKGEVFCGTVLADNFIVSGGINNDDYRILLQDSPRHLNVVFPEEKQVAF